MTLNAKQLRFVSLYQASVASGKPNAAQAYIDAGYKCSRASARAAAARLLADVSVQQLLLPAKQAAEIARVETVRGIEATREAVLERFWAVATADPNELIELRRTCCRYCYGQSNRYQRTRGEMDRDRAQYELKAAGRRPPPPPFDELGGIGYDPRKAPCPDCPECFGEGVERAFAKDTRNLSFGARCLYAGVKVTKDGLEIKTHDQQAALANVGKMLGVFTPEPKGDGAAPGGDTNVNVNVLSVGSAVVPAAVAGFLRDLGLPCPDALPAYGAGEPADRGEGADAAPEAAAVPAAH